MQKLLRQPVSKKIGLGFGLCLALLFCICTVAIDRMAKMNHVASQIVTHPLGAIESLTQFSTFVRQYRTTDYRYLTTIAPDKKRETEARFRELYANAEQALRSYEKTILAPADRQNCQILQTQWRTYVQMHHRILPICRANDIGRATPYLDGPMRDQFLALEAHLDRSREWNQQQSVALQRQSDADYRFSCLLVVGLFLGAVLMGGTAFWLITRNVDRIMREVMERNAVIQQMAEVQAHANRQDQLLQEQAIELAKAEERRRSQEALQESEKRYRSVVEHVKDVIFTADAAGHWTFLNPAWTAITGYSIEESLGQPFLTYVHEEDRPHYITLFEPMGRREKDDCRYEVRYKTKEGGLRWIEVRAQRILDAEDQVSGFFGTLTDITERKVAEEQLQHQALHDALTGLPNRLLFQDRLRGALGRAQRQQTAIGVLCVDLDNFKVINDSMGHEAGDTLLKTIAERLQACAPAEDTTARLGGDEFSLLLENLSRVEEATQVAERIVTQLQQPILLGEREVFASASVGIAYAQDVSVQLESLLRDADTAMYQAKANGKSGFVLFDPSMNAGVVERMEIEIGLRFALERGELRVRYQPLIDLETGYMSGMEALVRWEHPTHGLMPPGKFIPIAEETGLIVPIGYWVLEEACRQVQAWKIAYPDFGPLTINVNLSGKQLQRADVVQRVHKILEKTNLCPSDLKLEITESVMIADIENTVAKLTQLKALGVKLAMDDFGMGYSSMASLSMFPLDTVKIDRSFVKQLAEQEEAASIVAAIVMLSKSLHLDVTGEGIETEEQVTYLQGLGCHIGQGYYFAEPLSPNTLCESIAAGRHPFWRGNQQSDRELIEKLLSAA